MTTTTSRTAIDQQRPSEHALTLVVLTIGLAAWLAVTITHGSGAHSPGQLGDLVGGPATAHTQSAGDATATDHHHDGHTTTGPPVDADNAATILLLLGGWALMVIAMMLPPALPMLHTLSALTRRRRHPHVLLLVGTAAFITVWVAAGIGLLGGAAVLQAMAATQPWADQAPRYLTGAILIGAGLYQLSPLKRSCLRACRSPRSFALAHWRGIRSAAAELSATSTAYAISCIGCCWALMAITVTVGAAALPIMVALAVAMAAERLVPWGPRLVTPLGLLLCALGALTIAGLLPGLSSLSQ